MPDNPTPAPAPMAPVAQKPIPTITPPADTSSARDFFNQDDAALAEVWSPKAPEPGVAVVDPPETPEVSDEPMHAVPETVPTDDEGAEAVSAPTGEVVLPKVERKLMTEFQILDEEGELEIPDIKIKFKAKGEERELPLDHVVRLAQFGFANEEREQQVLGAKQFVREAQEKETKYQEAIQQYEGYYDRIFNDPAFYEEARLAYLSQNTPEARAQRAETELRQVHSARQAEQEDRAIAGFVQQVVQPTVTRLLTENPLVNSHEVIGRYSMLTAPLLVNGKVPVSKLKEVEAVVATDLATWVQQTQYERSLAQRRISADQQKATQQVVAAKRQTGRVFAQPGRVAEQQPKSTKFDSARSWLDATFPVPSE